MNDEHRTCRRKSRMTLIDTVRDVVYADPRVTVRDICDITGIPYGTVYRILVEELHMIKLFARWIPRILTNDNKAELMRPGNSSGGTDNRVIIHQPHNYDRRNVAIFIWSWTTLEIDLLGFQTIEHPAYSPDLAPMDFRVFWLWSRHWTEGDLTLSAIYCWLHNGLSPSLMKRQVSAMNTASSEMYWMPWWLFWKAVSVTFSYAETATSS